MCAALWVRLSYLWEPGLESVRDLRTSGFFLIEASQVIVTSPLQPSSDSIEQVRGPAVPPAGPLIGSAGSMVTVYV